LDKDDQEDPIYFHLYWISAVLCVIFTFLRTSSIYYTILHSSVRIHEKALWKLLRAPSIFFDANPIGRILTRYSKDTVLLDYFFGFVMNIVILTVSKTIGIYALILITVPWMAIPAVFCMIVMYFIRRRCIIAQNDSQRIEGITKGPINTKLGSTIDGLQTIRAYNKQSFFRQNFMKDSDINGDAMFTFFGVSRYTAALLDGVSVIFVFLNALIIVILKNHTDSLDLVLASISLVFSMEIAFMFSIAVRFGNEAENLMTSAQRCIEYVNMESEDELTKVDDPKGYPQNHDIEFKNMTMRYRKSLEPVLKNITIHIKAGQKVGIIGRTGAGKSSILQAIFRLVEIEEDGQMLIGGVDSRYIGLH
jgi:ABC-type multidrug transport system fused ATPase/permease subunit